MSEFISLQEGVAMTKAYREKRDDMISKGTISAGFLPVCETFSKADVTVLLNKDGCENLRIYLGLEEEKIRFIFVGVNVQDEDMLPTATGAMKANAENDDDGDDDDLLDRGVRCPTNCPPPSVLNG